ncbi:MAG TPA: peptide chain release factor N(5)-glutamine methyltransferase [Fimbriimonadaceae bacterium]|nr:peptide chain release factor N(5)-glutamine methyltransferase [Fimbriimonadaceae bacterium]
MTTGEWIQEAQGRLREAGIESAAIEAQLLAAHVLLRDRTYVLAHPGEEFPDLPGESLLQRRERHEPLAYILGWREFYGRRFHVEPGVLIPRHETEILVEAALGFLKSAGRPMKVLDLGTGSGCIGITLKLEFPAADVTLSDISERAVEIARANAGELGATVECVVADGFAGLGAFDLIVTNPPYVGLAETLPAEVRDFEPASALFPGEDGLEFYEMLAATAGLHLAGEGPLIMEVGYRQAREVGAIFEAAGWTVDQVVRDLSGIERVVVVHQLSA